MKKISMLMVAMIVIAVLSGCRSGPAAPTALSSQPSWLNETTPNDVFWGIGFSRLQNEQLAMRDARAMAQDELASQVKVTVRGSLDNFANESGLINDARSTRSIEGVYNTFVNTPLSGATVNARERMSDGTWWIRVELKKEEVQRQVTRIVNNEMADFADFQRERAIQRLNHDIERARPN